MTLNDKKRAYIDTEIFKILALVEESEDSIEPPNEETGSIAHKVPYDLTHKSVDRPITRGETNFDEVVSKRECYRGTCIGLNKENYEILKKLVTAISQEKTIKNTVGKKFIEEQTFKWLITTFKAKKVEQVFSDYILEEMKNAIQHYKIHFPILYLDINRPFKLGKASFDFFTKEYFNSVHEYHLKHHPQTYNNNSMKDLKDNYQGKVFIAYTLHAEQGKAQETAFSYCSLAVDILKMCSETTDYPFIKLGFDIDSRIRINPQSEIIIADANNLPEGFRITMTRPTHHHKIDDKECNNIAQRQAGDFHHFLLSLNEDPTELQKLIINGIKRYGNAISNHNLHQRVVELFTILESLLLLDANSPIIDSLCKYCSKLVFQKVEDRKVAIDLLKSMYAVRSKLIHHGAESKFEMLSLRRLQLVVVMLLAALIRKTSVHKTKQTLLQEIDEAILKAY